MCVLVFVCVYWLVVGCVLGLCVCVVVVVV